MLSKERSYRILQRIEQRGFVTVVELMEYLSASRSSIMRDLIQLEKEGKIQRERGGASKKGTTMLLPSDEPTVNDKTNIHYNCKEKLCLEASKKIMPGQCIYIDAGTTTQHIVKYIQGKNVTIVTSSIYLIRNLPTDYDGEVYILGGLYKNRYDMALGSITVDMIDRFNFDHAFFSTSGFDIYSKELYSSNFSIGAIKKAVMNCSDQNHLLVDDSKYKIRSISTWAYGDDFTTIYLNSYPIDLEKPASYIVV